MDQEMKEVPIRTEKLENQLKEWGIDLEKLKYKASLTKADAKSEVHKEIASLRARLNEAQGKLTELKTAGDAASSELKKGVENAWAELKKAVENATAKFK